MQPRSAPTSATPTTKPERRYDVDWLRLMAVFLLYTFHTARVFDPWEPNYVQNVPLSQRIFDIFMRPVSPWHMSLFFLLAGASTYFALRFRRGGGYVKERVKRLFIPFVFGVLVLIPPQSYLGLLSHAGTSDSFFQWFPQFFKLQPDDVDGYFLGGHTWGQLWFIIHLFVYSLVALPLFLYLNSPSGRRLISRLAEWFTRPGVLFLYVLPVALSQEFPEVGGGNPVFYIIFFIYGFLLMSDARFSETIDRQRVLLLVLGPVIFAVLLLLVYTEILPEELPGWVEKILDIYTESFVPWLVILALLAYGKRLLNFTNRFLKYFAEAAYPLYLLHQTAIIVIAYYVVQWDVAVGVKFALIVLASFASTVVVYDVLVRRTNVTRFLFGMRPLVKK